MLKNKSIAIPNSFTFQFKNTTNYAQTITLFREGTSTSNDVKNVLTSGQTNNLNFVFPTLPAIIWNFIGNQPFYYFTPLTATLTTYPTINDVFIRDTGNIDLISDNVIAPLVFSTISVPVTAGESLQVVNERINQYIRDFADTTNFRNANGDVMVFNFTIDFSIIQNETLPLILGGFKKPYGISVQYPQPDLPIGSTFNPIRLLDIVSPSSAFPCFGNIHLVILSPSASANGVEVIDVGNVTYNEIKESQNGGALDVRSLTINVASAPSQFEAQSQLLQPLKFKKIDVNGNEVEYVKNQPIDPYQFQNSFSDVQLTYDGEVYVLDGNTKFEYVIEANTSLNLTYNYVQVRNSTFGTESAQEEMQQDLKNIAGLDDDSSNARELVISSNFDGNELDATQPTKNVSNKTNYFIPLLLGGIALYLLFNLKSNQK
jgi:hypothetical protein